LLFLVLLLLLLLVLLLALFTARRGRLCRRLLPFPLLFLLPTLLFGRRHRLRWLSLAFPVLFLLRRGRALRGRGTLAPLSLLLFPALFSRRRRRCSRLGRALLFLFPLAALLGVRRGRGLRGRVLLSLAKLLRLLQTQRILLYCFQELFHLLRGLQRLRDHCRRVCRPRALRTLRLLQQLHLLAHMLQCTLEQRGNLIPPGSC
jgi:hypothetical protein